MEKIGAVVQERYERVIIENEMLRAGFAAVPYVVLRDTGLSVGARLAYAVLLSYAWQAGSCFPGQQRMAEDMGVSDRHLRRFLGELRIGGYVSWKKRMPGGTNTYWLHDVRSKLKAEAKRTPVSGRSGHRGPVNLDARVRLIDAAEKTQRHRPSSGAA